MFHIAREKHLDHMVKVVPFIVTCYAIQCFVIVRFGGSHFALVSLSILGGLLACMIGAFIFYDLKHKVTLFEEHLEISFLGRSKTVLFSQIQTIVINDPGQAFSTLIIRTSNKKVIFHFIDDAEKVKAWIEARQSAHIQKAA